MEKVGGKGTYGIFVQGVDETADGCSVVHTDQKLGNSLTLPKPHFSPVASHANSSQESDSQNIIQPSSPLLPSLLLQQQRFSARPPLSLMLVLRLDHMLNAMRGRLIGDQDFHHVA